METYCLDGQVCIKFGAVSHLFIYKEQEDLISGQPTQPKIYYKLDRSDNRFYFKFFSYILINIKVNWLLNESFLASTAANTSQTLICSVRVETSIHFFLKDAKGREVHLFPLFCLAGARGVEFYQPGGLIVKSSFFACTATTTSETTDIVRLSGNFYRFLSGRC